MSSKLKPLNDTQGNLSSYIFYCPGCKSVHPVDIKRWTFNNDLEKPTFNPSLLVYEHLPKQPRCHSYIISGKIQYLADCKHELAGKTVDMIDWNDDLW